MIRHILAGIFFGACYICAGSGADAVSCTGRTQYSAPGATTCSTVDAGYYTTGCDADGNNCTGQSQCTGTTYCTDGVQHECPDAETHKRTTFPDNYYDTTTWLDSSVGHRDGRTTVTECLVTNWLTGTRGRLYERVYYNPDTSKYDIRQNYGWSNVSKGYYLTTKGACGSYAYYLDNKPCPAGSYCPGKTPVECNASNRDSVHTETFGLVQCPAGHYSAAGASACNASGSGYYTIGCNDSGTNCTGRAQCPATHPSSGIATTNINGCYRACMGGSYMANASDTKCTDVGTRYWVANSSVYYPNAGWRNACPAGTTTTGASYGADEVADCGHVLNIDGTKLRLRGVKKTSPSLAVQVGDAVFYANMSQNTHNITAGTTRFLKSDYENSIYYIYDDTARKNRAYPWDADGFDVNKNGNSYDYDASQMMWSTTFDWGVVNGVAACNNNTGAWLQTSSDEQINSGGMNCWCKMTGPATSLWVFLDPFSTTTVCALNCAFDCALHVHNYSVFRAGLFSAVAD